MFNRLFLAVIAALLLLSPPIPSHAVGTIPFSMTQQIDQYGNPLSGCLLYTIQAGTTSTPQNAYKDTALSIPQPNPMVCDSSGRLPQFFLADGQIKIRLLDKLGNPQVVLDNILVIGPSSGGGSGATIDPATIAATGDLKQAYGTQALTGWVRLNGRTIGNTASGATELASTLQAQALFIYLYNTDPNLVVSGGRTGNALNDFNNNKLLTLPDGRGRALSGLDDMGNAAAGRLTATYFGATGGCSAVLGTTLGAACGGESSTTTLAQLPTGITSATAAAVTVTAIGSRLFIPVTSGAVGSNPGTPSSGGVNSPTSAAGGGDWASVTSLSTSGVVPVTSNNTGGTAHPTIDPRILVTIYIKL